MEKDISGIQGEEYLYNDNDIDKKQGQPLAALVMHIFKQISLSIYHW